MSKEDNKTDKPKNKRGNYEEKIEVEGSFIDIIKASVKHANKNSSKKKKDSE